MSVIHGIKYIFFYFDVPSLLKPASNQGVYYAFLKRVHETLSSTK
jgi:hypothetical protein